jgi:5,10-methylenetetrahydromethanopterin reductase
MVARVEISLGLFPTESPRRMVELIRLAEDLDYGCVYVGDSQMIWREAFVILGAAAQATSRIALATGVTNPITRDPSVVAAACETLQQLSGGRARLGIGTGDSSVETLGKKPATLTQLEQTVAFTRALLAGQPVTHPESGAQIHLTYVQPGPTAPIYIAVSSPRIHALAGRVADGAIVLVGTDPRFLAASRHTLQAGAAAVGRDLGAEGFRIVCWTPCSIADDGRVARAAVKAHVARVLKRKLPFELSSETQEVVRQIRQQYAYYEHMVPGTAHGELVPDELVEQFALAGTREDVREQLQRLAASGLVDEIAIIPHTLQPAERERIIRIVGELIPTIGVGTSEHCGATR